VNIKKHRTLDISVHQLYYYQFRKYSTAVTFWQQHVWVAQIRVEVRVRYGLTITVRATIHRKSLVSVVTQISKPIANIQKLLSAKYS